MGVVIHGVRRRRSWQRWQRWQRCAPAWGSTALRVQRLHCCGWGPAHTTCCDACPPSTLHPPNPSTARVRSVDWSPDGQSVASGGRDKVLKLWRR